MIIRVLYRRFNTSIFFFFKQKTAYEMRISDWSSDVCSSDLIEGREKILAVHMKKVPLAPDVNPRTIARGTPGFSGDDIANLVNEAALMAARRGKSLVDMDEFEAAKAKVMMGRENGRASGRERVSQDVAVTGVGGASKKKNR